MKSTHYIIHRINLDIEAPDASTAITMQDDAVRIFNNWIIPKLEDLLARIVPDNVVLHLDTLDLSLDSIEPIGFEQEFGEAFLSTLHKKIEQVVAAADGADHGGFDEPVTTMREEERYLSIFIYFIKTGQLPWWCEKDPQMVEEEPLIRMLEQQSLQGSEEIMRLTSLLATETRATERLFLQFSPHFIDKLITLLVDGKNSGSAEELNKQAADNLRKLAKVSPATTTSAIKGLREIFLAILRLQLDAASSAAHHTSPHPNEDIETILQDLRWQERNTTSQSPEKSTDDKASQQLSPREEESLKGVESADKGMYIDHAGLVLLHPFLEYYFKEFELLKKQQFRDTSARNLGIHLLNYLATGRETPPEYLLTLEKFLCGSDLLAPIPRYMQLTDHMMEESDKLLQAAIGHWQALKSTSPDGLREGFIQRSGKLIKSSFECRLIVEGKGQDVLLNYLPWGYGLIKLPWLNAPLFVDWGN